MTELKCPYCRNAMEPLDNHGAKITNDKAAETKDGLVPMQMITCVLNRYYIVDARRP